MDASHPDSPPIAGLFGQLTDRERQVVARRASGQDVAEIASGLTVEPRTVKFRLRHLGAPGIHLFVTDTATACAALSRIARSAAAKA